MVFAATTFTREAVLSVLALAVVPFVFAAPAYADNISIDLDTTAVTLQRSGNLYKHNSSVRVRNGNTYGFTLSMDASQPNLVNDKDSTYKIDSVSGANQQLAINQWGYGMGKDATMFSSVYSATLADVTSDSKGDCTSVDDCTLYLTFGANLDQKRLPTGSYSTSLTYTATSKPAPYVPPAPDPEPYVPPEPPKPKWTTNGCRNLYTGSMSGDNCRFDSRSSAYYPFLVGWTGSKWVNYSEYSYGSGRWALGTGRRFIPHHIVGPVRGEDKELPVAAYVPRFARSGYYIRFCKDSHSSGCTNSEVESAFAGGRLGVWVALTRLGCTEHVLSDTFADKSYDAYSAALTLAQAFGSPCPD